MLELEAFAKPERLTAREFDFIPTAQDHRQHPAFVDDRALNAGEIEDLPPIGAEEHLGVQLLFQQVRASNQRTFVCEMDSDVVAL